MRATLQNFLKLESAGGIVLMGAAALAMIVANSPLQEFYWLLLDVSVEIRVGELEIAKPLILWVNDGLMAIFFFLIGLELKREIFDGELSTPAKVLLPATRRVCKAGLSRLQPTSHLHWVYSCSSAVAYRPR